MNLQWRPDGPNKYSTMGSRADFGFGVWIPHMGVVFQFRKSFGDYGATRPPTQTPPRLRLKKGVDPFPTLTDVNFATFMRE